MKFLLVLGLFCLQDDPPRDSPEDEKARPVVDRAMALIREAKAAEKKEERDAKYAEAIESFRDVVKHHKKSRFYGTSYFNIGAILVDFLDRPEDAIKHFKELVASDVDDRDDSGQLMSPYRNYRYHAWRLTAGCESKLKRPARAVVALFSMRDAYVSHCGTCVSGMLDGFRESLVKQVRELTPHVEKETIEEALGKDKKPDAFLLDYGKALRDAKRIPEAKAALKAVMEEWPKTDRAIEAERILTELK